MPSTAEYWDVDGESLQEFDANLRSTGGSREEPPPLRGNDDNIPFSYGELWIEKIPDARQMELDGWMVDTSERRLKHRWRAFRKLLWRPHEQFELTRRWYNEDDELVVGTGLAGYVAGLAPTMQAGGTRLEFKVQLKMADPFFYSEQQQINMPIVGPYSPRILGDYASKFVEVQLYGAQQSPSLTIWRKGQVDNLLRYGNLSGGTALLDVNRGRATETIGGSIFPTSTKVGHSGRTDWLHLSPETTRIDYSRAATGSGTAVIRYRPAHI